MAYPRYISKSAFASGTGALTVDALTGTQAGDIAILFVESANQTIATPTDYKVLAAQVGTGAAAAIGGVRIATFYRILEDVADTATSVADSGNHTTAIKMLFRDTSLVDGAFFVAATSVQATASTAMTFPAVVAATDESLIVLAVALDTDAASTTTVGNVTNASLANITERHDQTVTAGVGGGLAVITGEAATAGSIGTSTATGSTSVTRAYHTISLSRATPQTTTASFNRLSTVNYAALSDAMRITAGVTGSVRAASSGTFQPDTLTNGIYGIETKWYYRQYGTDAWTTTAGKPNTEGALVSAGALDAAGEFTNNEIITGLTDGVEYEFVLFGNRVSATPPNDISFSATASIALSNNGVLNATETGQDTASGTGNVTVPVQGFLSSLESGSDTATLAGNVLVRGSFTAAETGSDTATISGITGVSGVTGSLAATEIGNDTAIITGSVPVRGILSSVEIGLDAASVLGVGAVGAITGTVAALETSADTCSSHGFTSATNPIIEYDISLFSSMRSSTNVRGAYKSLKGLEHMMWDRVLQKCVYNPNVYVTAADPDTLRIGYGRPITRSVAIEEAELKKAKENVWLRSKLTELYKRVVSVNPTAELSDVLLSTLYYYHLENQKR